MTGVHRQTLYKLEKGTSRGARDTIKAIVETYAENGVGMDKGVIHKDNETEEE